jgi:hypothetical protein
MNVLCLKAIEIEAHALSTLATVPDVRASDRPRANDLAYPLQTASSVPAVGRSARPSRAILLASAAVASLGLLVAADLLPSAASQWHDGSQVPTAHCRFGGGGGHRACIAAAHRDEHVNQA